MRLARLLVGCGMIAGATPGALGAWQPPAQPESQPEARQTAEEEREAYKQRLERRLEEIRAIEAYIESAITKLDEGADPDDIRQGFRSPNFDRGGPPRRPEGDRLPPPDDRPPPDDPERIRAFIAKHLPDLNAWLDQQAEEDPERARAAAERLWHRLGPIAELEDSDPELFVLRLDDFRVGMAIFDAVRRYREVAAKEGPESDAAAAGRDEIRDLLVRQADLRIDAHRHELATVEARVESLRDELAKMDAERTEMIEKRVELFTDLNPRGRWGDRRDRRPRNDGGN